VITYLEAPDYSDKIADHPTVFLAGGITNCRDWQTEARAEFNEAASDLMIMNPRAATFDVTDKSRAAEQIEWEHDHLSIADVIMFWFCQDTIQPITLYELGSWTSVVRWIPESPPAVVVGAHPDYGRRFDIVQQLRLKLPELTVFNTLTDTVRAAIVAANTNQWHF
jgi:hypothetical protein